MTARISRAAAGIPSAAPVRALHLGLGSFHRSHQAWYTAGDPQWGIASYTFRNTELPRVLTGQDGLYTLLVRGDEDQAEVVGSLSRAHAGTEHGSWLADVTSPEVALITLTVTEAAYANPEPGQDSAMSRLMAGLRERFRTSGAPLTLVPCDNIPHNGSVLRSVVLSASEDDYRFSEWLDEHVSIVSTVVDRITPASTDADVATAAHLTGWHDHAPVVTEPFTEWLLSGEFPAGRPAWQNRGARFVDDVGIYQQRKLWLLNGAHSLLAYAGLARGRGTVSEAIQDDFLADVVEQWWDTAARHISLDSGEVANYRKRLLERFAAPGIRHQLAQIATDGSQKLPARLLPVLRAERSAGRLPGAIVTGLAAWVAYLRRTDVRDACAAQFTELANQADAPRRVLAALDPEIGTDAELVSAVRKELTHLRD